jgi:hypothetical protein
VVTVEPSDEDPKAFAASHPRHENAVPGEPAAPRPPARSLRPAAAALTALVVVACAAFVSHPARGREAVATPSPPDPVALSHALTAAPDPVGSRVGHADLPAVAAGFASQTPYPPGASDDFDWSATPSDPRDMAAIDDRAEVQFLVEYRAQCRWLRSWLATRSDVALAVLRDVPRWPALRQDADGQLQADADAAAAGDVAAIQRQVDVNCRS